MTAGQIALSPRRLQAPVVAAMVVVAFAIGTLTGFNLPNAVGGRPAPATISGAGLDAAAAHDMSAAAYAAMISGAAHDMSAAAYAAVHPATITGAALDAASVHDMTAGAYAALHPATITGAALDAAAAHDMSAAAYAALHPGR